MAGGTTLFERRLMQIRLLALFGLIAVAFQADAYRIALRQSGVGTRMRAMAIGAIARCSRVLDPCLRDQLSFVGMAGNTKIFYVRLSKNDLAIFRRSVAGGARLLGKRGMEKPCHQPGRRGLVRVMAAGAVRCREGLILMCLLERCVLGVVAIQAERRHRLGQVELVLWAEFGAGLVYHVARVAAHFERGVAAASLRNIYPFVMASQAEIVF